MFSGVSYCRWRWGRSSSQARSWLCRAKVMRCFAAKSTAEGTGRDRICSRQIAGGGSRQEKWIEQRDKGGLPKAAFCNLAENHLSLMRHAMKRTARKCGRQMMWSYPASHLKVNAPARCVSELDIEDLQGRKCIRAYLAIKLSNGSSSHHHPAVPLALTRGRADIVSSEPSLGTQGSYK